MDLWKELFATKTKSINMNYTTKITLFIYLSTTPIMFCNCLIQRIITVIKPQKKAYVPCAVLADFKPMENFNNPFGALSSTGLPVGPATPEKPVKLGRVVLRKEKAHRGGKTVIVVHDFAPQITGAQIETFAGKLKKACGCGGTVKDRTIEIQGDHPSKIRALLEAEGFQVAGVK